MCGIAGFYSSVDAGHKENTLSILTAMGAAIVHRGPDDYGTWIDENAGLGFVHRRLSILDLSPAGHQPMLSPSGRFVIVFNGEIYNHRELRVELDGLQQNAWRGHSDTETLLAAIEAWGLETAVKRCVGMFAFALWDRQDRRLSLARDRLGEKPLYYGWQRGTFLFGSELKALRRHPAFVGELNRNAIALQFRHNYIPAPYSVYDAVAKLEPGHILSLDCAALRSFGAGEKVAYWTARDAALTGLNNRYSGSESKAVETLDLKLRQSISMQMVADVPLGAFLSGGIDSSTVVALMQAQSTRAVKTFTIGFNEEGYNEAKHASVVARHLGTDHTELYVTPEEARSVIPLLPTVYDEPFSDSSQIPTFLVSRLARQSVTVALSGDGGDELFCGYQRYALSDALWRRISIIPEGLRAAAAGALERLPVGAFNALGHIIARTLGKGPARLGDRLQKAGAVLRQPDPEAIYRSLVSHWNNPSAVVIGSTEPRLPAFDPAMLAGVEELTHRMMLMDTISYLPDDILVKVDRAAMANSLETRVPLLDHRVMEFAWSLPLHMKRNADGGPKHILRQVLYRYVPRALVDRPKMGFGVPIGSWLRGPLRDWAESLLDEKRMREDGLLQAEPIRRLWAEHLSGVRDWQYQLWDVLMFQAWHQATKAADCVSSNAR